MILCVGYENAYYNLTLLDQWFSSVVPGLITSVSPRHLLEMYILGPHLRPIESGGGAWPSVF